MQLIGNYGIDDGLHTKAEAAAWLLDAALNHLIVITGAYGLARTDDFGPDSELHLRAVVHNAENEVHDLVKAARRAELVYLAESGLVCADQGEGPDVVAALGGPFTFAREMPEEEPAATGAPA